MGSGVTHASPHQTLVRHPFCCIHASQLSIRAGPLLENLVPVSGIGSTITKDHQLRREVIKQKVMHKKEKREEKKALTLAKLSLSEAELRRLGSGLRQ